jgi:hypothetical protein
MNIDYNDYLFIHDITQKCLFDNIEDEPMNYGRFFEDNVNLCVTQDTACDSQDLPKTTIIKGKSDSQVECTNEEDIENRVFPSVQQFEFEHKEIHK